MKQESIKNSEQLHLTTAIKHKINFTHYFIKKNIKKYFLDIDIISP